MESHYKINVSHTTKGHYFATAPHSLMCLEAKAQEVARDIRARFPEAEGFKVTLTRWEGTGRGVKF